MELKKKQQKTIRRQYKYLWIRSIGAGEDAKRVTSTECGLKIGRDLEVTWHEVKWSPAGSSEIYCFDFVGQPRPRGVTVEGQAESSSCEPATTFIGDCSSWQRSIRLTSLVRQRLLSPFCVVLSFRKRRHGKLKRSIRIDSPSGHFRERGHTL